MSVPTDVLPLIALLGGLFVVLPCAFAIAARKRRKELPTPCVVVRRLWSVPAGGLAVAVVRRPGVAPRRTRRDGAAADSGSNGVARPAATLRVFRLPAPDELPSMAATRAPRVVRVDPETWRVEVAAKADSGLRLAVSDGGAEPPEISADEGVAVRPVPAAAVAQLRTAMPVDALLIPFLMAAMFATEPPRASSPITATLFSALAAYGAVVMILAYRHTAVAHVFQRLGTAVDGHWATVDETADAGSPAAPRREAAPVDGAPRRVSEPPPVEPRRA